MEDYKFLIYIVLSILYFLFKGRGKKKKPVTRKNNPSPTPNMDQQEERRPKTFEEILAELSGEGRKQADEENPSEILEEAEEIKSLSDQVEERPIDQQVSAQDYENADETLKELYRKGEKLKSLDELVDIEEVRTSSERFQEFEEDQPDNTFASEIKDSLSDPDSAKKAIILSEILNRRY